MPSKLCSYFVQAVILEEDEDGRIVGREMTQPVEVFGRDGLLAHADQVEAFVAERSAAESYGRKA